MEATLKFNLPEEQNDFDIACKAMSWALVVWDMDQKLRNWIKYGDEDGVYTRDRVYNIGRSATE
jgi:hypothetical protein